MNPGQKIEINSQTTNEKIKRAAAALKQNSRPTKGNIKRQMKTCGTAKFKISKATWDNTLLAKINTSSQQVKNTNL